MTLESLIDTYGYLAILVGTFFEGETILVLGGLAAYREYLGLPWVNLDKRVYDIRGTEGQNEFIIDEPANDLSEVN